MIFKSGYKVTQGYGRAKTSPYFLEYYKKFGLLGHEGLDVVYKKYEAVPYILADHKSIIVQVHSGNSGDYGRFVTVWVQELNIAFQYCHLDSVMVSVGDNVTPGDILGVAGRSGNGKDKAFLLHTHINGIPVDDNGYRNGNTRNGYGGNVDPEKYFTEKGRSYYGI